MGGRPVIYERDSEFYDLPESLRWRHVCYEPDINNPIDFTWEREWRIQAEAFPLDPGEIEIIVPNSPASEDLEHLFNQHEWARYQWEWVGYGESIAMYPEPLIYSIKPLNN